jgi:hypothetical protein
LDGFPGSGASSERTCRGRVAEVADILEDEALLQTER